LVSLQAIIKALFKMETFISSKWKAFKWLCKPLMSGATGHNCGSVVIVIGSFVEGTVGYSDEFKLFWMDNWCVFSCSSFIVV
jgi:hypothetical protein